MTGPRSLESHLRKEILGTGFPLEIEVSSILDRNWIVYNNDPYVDEDEDKTREIDIFAIHGALYEKPQDIIRRDFFPVAQSLVIECKKSTSHAWIFFSLPRPSDWEPGIPDGHVFDFLEAITQGKHSFIDELKMPKLHYDRSPRLAYNYVETKITKDARGESGSIFEAQNQLWKCVSYNCKVWREAWEKDKSSRHIAVHFPIVVFDGRLYEATGPSRRLILTQRQHILLYFSRRSKTLGTVKEYMIDIVTKDYFQDYLKIVKSDMRKISEYFDKNAKSLAPKADKLAEFFA